MRNTFRSLVSMFLLAAPLAGFAQQQHQQLKPNELATNLAGATTKAAPPRGFDPLTASAQDLEYFGFPPRPNEITNAVGFAGWKSAMIASTKRVTPILEQTNIFHGPTQKKAAVAGEESNTASSYNWSGYVNASGASNYSSSSFYFLEADYIVPVARQAFGACTGSWDYSSSWVGIDGYGSNDVLQAGSESDAYCSGSTTATYYSAWYEWYPFGSVRIPSLPIVPGDDLFVEVWSTSSTAGHAYIVNKNTNQYVNISFSAPSGTTLKGNSAEWIEERPGINGGLATLTNYIADPFWGAVAETFGYSPIYPGSASSFPVTMLDNSGNPISYSTLLGTTSFLMQDEGTAY